MQHPPPRTWLAGQHAEWAQRGELRRQGGNRRVALRIEGCRDAAAVQHC